MISTELSIILGKQFHFLWFSILTLLEHFEKMGGSGKTGHCEGREPLREVYRCFFYSLRPFKLKKSEWLANSKISSGPYCRAWTTITGCLFPNVSATTRRFAWITVTILLHYYKTYALFRPVSDNCCVSFGVIKNQTLSHNITYFVFSFKE